MKIQEETESIYTLVGGWLAEQNRQLLGEDAAVGLQFSARDEAGQIVGGVTGAVQHGILNVHLLALSPDHRRLGLGGQLMRALETAARQEGASEACVDTLEFEAPDFYQKQGYLVLGVVGEMVGRRKYFLSKKLGEFS